MIPRFFIFGAEGIKLGIRKDTEPVRFHLISILTELQGRDGVVSGTVLVKPSCSGQQKNAAQILVIPADLPQHLHNGIVCGGIRGKVFSVKPAECLVSGFAGKYRGQSVGHGILPGSQDGGEIADHDIIIFEKIIFFLLFNEAAA